MSNKINELLMWQQAIDDYSHDPEHSGIDIKDAREKRDNARKQIVSELDALRAELEAAKAELAQAREKLRRVRMIANNKFNPASDIAVIRGIIDNPLNPPEQEE